MFDIQDQRVFVATFAGALRFTECGRGLVSSRIMIPSVPERREVLMLLCGEGTECGSKKGRWECDMNSPRGARGSRGDKDMMIL